MAARAPERQQLAPIGWSAKSLKPGDQLPITIEPLRSEWCAWWCLVPDKIKFLDGSRVAFTGDKGAAIG